MSEQNINMEEVPEAVRNFMDREYYENNNEKQESGIVKFFKGLLNVFTFGIFRKKLFPPKQLNEDERSMEELFRSELENPRKITGAQQEKISEEPVKTADVSEEKSEESIEKNDENKNENQEENAPATESEKEDLQSNDSIGQEKSDEATKEEGMQR